jgi:AcrR family transcriptional regulator
VTPPTPPTPPQISPALVPRSVRADARRNREAVLEAARKLFAEKGFETGMDEVARKAKVGVGTVYRHFPTKEDLFDALMTRRFETLTARAREAVEEAENGDAWEAFRSFIEFDAELQAGDKGLAEAMASRSERMACAAEDSGLIVQAERLIELTKKAGALRKDLAVEDIPAMLCSIGSVSLAAAEKPRMRWERLLAIWLDGVREPGSKRLPPIPADASRLTARR